MGIDISGAGAVVQGVDDILHMFFPDKSQEERSRIAQVFQMMQQQSDINKVLAGQPGVHFRDGAGWVCVTAFAIAAFKPIVEWTCILLHHPVTLPPVDTTLTGEMLLGLLGLGGMHMYQQVSK